MLYRCHTILKIYILNIYNKNFSNHLKQNNIIGLANVWRDTLSSKMYLSVVYNVTLLHIYIQTVQSTCFSVTYKYLINIIFLNSFNKQFSFGHNPD